MHAGFVALGPGGSQRLAAGADPFFDPRPLGIDPVAQGSVGFRLGWSGATFAYDALFNARRLVVPVVVGGKTDPHVFQQAATVTWDSPCKCFKVGANAIFTEGQKSPSVRLVFDLSSLGGARTP